MAQAFAGRAQRPAQEDGRERQAHELGDGERPPHQLQPSGQGEQIRHRQQHADLAADRDDQTVKRRAERLKDAARDDAEARERERQADDAQRGPADGQHLLRGGEETEQRTGDDLEERKTHAHDGDGCDSRKADRPAEALRLARTVVVRNDRHHRVIQAEDGHENEALELEVRAEHRRRRLGKGDEDLVHAEHHHRADGLHDDGRHADRVDLLDRRGVRTDLAAAQMHVGIAREVEIEADGRADELTDNGGDRRTGDLQPREAEQAENEDGVENDVGGRAGDLRDHGEVRASRRLQQALIIHLEEQADRAADADGHIVASVSDDLRVVRLKAEERSRKRPANEGEEHKIAQRQKQSHIRRAVRARLILLAQRAGEQRVHTHTRAAGKGDAQRLERERK